MSVKFTRMLLQSNSNIDEFVVDALVYYIIIND
jgi:hypothetical protein